ncbi:hypothetical protein GCM10010433_27280 [Streptomyces pulveraceus]
MGSGGGQRCPDAVVRRRPDHGQTSRVPYRSGWFWQWWSAAGGRWDHGHRHLYVYRAADIAGPAGQPALWEMLFLSDAKDATEVAGKHVVPSTGTPLPRRTWPSASATSRRKWAGAGNP